MSRAEQGDSGNYTCVPDNAPAVFSLLHVIEGTESICEAFTVRVSDLDGD